MEGSTVRWAASTVAAIFASAAVMTASDVEAQLEDGDPRITEAQAAFEAGQAAFDGRDYVGALEHFQRAHELTGAPEILYNVGLVADRMGNDALALESFEGYLRGDPNAHDRARIEARIAELRRARDADSAGEVAAPHAEAQPSESGRLFTWIGLGLAGALGIGAAFFWVDAQNEFDDLQVSCGGSCSEEAIDASGGRTSQALGNGLFAGGLVALAAAGVLFFVEAPSAEPDELVEVGVGPGAVHLRGSF